MEKSKYFNLLWRFNAVVIAVAGVLSIILLLFTGYHVFKDIFRERQVDDIVNITEKYDLNEKWSLSHVREIDGTNFIIVPLESDQSYAQSYYSKSATSYRNHLFINTVTTEQKWLFDTNDWLIGHNEFLFNKKYGDKNREVIAILYNIVKVDTNNDKRLTTEDKVTVALCYPSGEKYTEILPSIDKLIGHSLIGNSELLILYQNDNIGYSAKYSLDNLSLISQRKLTKIKDNS